jgi:hypothetical protein
MVAGCGSQVATVVLVTVLFPRIRSQVGVTPSQPKSAAKLHSFGMRVSDISVLVYFLERLVLAHLKPVKHCAAGE